MDQLEATEFLETIQTKSSRILDLTDAYVYAMRHVREYNGPKWFGPLLGGTFYCDGDVVRWFPNTKPLEAIYSLTAEFGDELTSSLEY